MEAHAQSERQVAAVLMAAGAKGVTLPDPADARRRFDAALAAPLQSSDRDTAAVLEVMGLTA